MKNFFTVIIFIAVICGYPQIKLFSQGLSVTATATPSSICNGASSSLIASSNESGTTYIWMPGGLTGSTVSVNPSSTTTYTVTGTAVGTGDTGSATVTIVVNITPVLNPSATPPEVCRGDNGNLCVTQQANTTYVWNPGALAGNCVTVHPASTTTYIVTGTNTVSLCTASAVVTLVVYNKPVIAATASPAITCSNGNTTLSVNCTANCTGVSYSWMPGDLPGASIIVHPSVTTTYTVTATNAGGCTSSTTVSITVNPKPNITPTASPATICQGASSSLGATSSVVGTTYLWNPDDLNGTPVSVTPAVTTIYTVTGTSPAGCTGTSTVIVTPIPVITPTATPASICQGSSSSLSAGSNEGGTTYVWTPGGLAGTPVTVTPAVTTTYFVTGTAAGCTGLATVTVTVNPNPVITPTASPGIICSGSSSSLTAGSTVVGTTYNWTPGNLIGTPVSVSPASVTTYTVTGTAAGCTGTSTLIVIVNANITPTFNPVAPICSGSALVRIPTTSTNIPSITGTWAPPLDNTATTTYTFTPTAGQCAITSTLTIAVNPNITPAFNPVAAICSGAALAPLPVTSVNGITGIWVPALNNTVTTTYTFTPIAGQCATTTTQNIIVIPIPVLNPIASPNPISRGYYTVLKVTPEISTTYIWYPGNISGALETNIHPMATTIYTVTGTNTITGCTATSTLTVEVNQMDVINSSGGSSQYSEGYMAYSLGEAIIGTSIGSNTTLTQGFLQTWKSFARQITLKLFLEGLYSGSSMMREATDFDPVSESFPLKWGAGIADTVTVVLYDDVYANLIAKYPGVYLHTDGNLVIPVVASSLNGSYYITIFPRNSVPITTATPQSFASSTISYDFTYPIDQAYGVGAYPQKYLGDGFYGMYTGELDHDSYFVIDGSDVSILDPDIISGPFGYLITDLNGDGVVDGSDMSIMDANSIFGPLFWNPTLAKKHLIIDQNK